MLDQRARAARPVRRRADRRTAPELFFFSPYFSTDEKKDGLHRAVEGAEPALDELPRGADRAPPDAGDLPRSGRATRSCGTRRCKLLPVAGDQRGRARRGDRRRSIGERIGEQTERHGRALERGRPRHPRWHRAARRQRDPRRVDQEPAEPTSQASRAGVATLACQGATQCRSSPTRSPQSSRAGSKASTPRARTSPRSGPCCRSPTVSAASTASRTACRSRCSSFPHDVTGLALNLESDNVGAVLFGEWEKIVEGDTVRAHQAAARDSRRRRAARPDRRSARQPARRQGRDQHARRRARSSTRRRASSSVSR